MPMLESDQPLSPDDVKPPATQVGIIGWVRANCFDGWFNSALTLLALGFLGSIVPPLVKWAFLNAVWFSPSGACQQAVGACWSIVTQNFRFIIFGFYPYEQQWRPLAALLILLGLLIYSHDRRWWSKWLGYAWIIGLMAITVLMRGGIWGLPPVESEKWGWV